MLITGTREKNSICKCHVNHKIYITIKCPQFEIVFEIQQCNLVTYNEMNSRISRNWNGCNI